MAFVEKNSVDNFKLIAEKVKGIKSFKQIYGIELTLTYDKEKYRICVLAKNNNGLKNIYNLLHLSNLNDNKIQIKDLETYRNDILVGLVLSEIESLSLDIWQIEEIIEYFDYVELIPENDFWEIINRDNSLELGDLYYLYEFAYWGNMQDFIIQIIDICRKNNQIIMPSSNCKHVYVNCLGEEEFSNIKLTKEMLEYFGFLEPELAYEIVITNSNKIADSIEEIDINN